MGLAAKLTSKIEYQYSGAADLGSVSARFDGHAGVDLDNGTGANQADKLFADTRTLTTGANEDLDLAGSLIDPLGATLTFVKVKGLLIKSHPSNTTNLTVKPGASNGFLGPFGAATHTITIPPGGSFMWTAPGSGFAVTASTGDLVNVANAAGASADYDIVVVGTSA